MGAVGGPGFRTSVIPLGNGFERRNVEWSKAKANYDVAHGLKDQTELNALLKFFYARMGKAYGFRFKDWSDYKLPFTGEAAQALCTTNGATSVFQVYKTYTDAGGTYNRIIQKIVAGTFVLKNNGVVSADYTVDVNTGLVTLGVTLRATTGRAITVACEFDIPVRFDIDDMKVSFADYNNYTWGQIPLTELRLN